MNGVRHVEHILRLFSFSVNHLLDIMLLNYEYFSDADDFEPPAPVGPATDKWEGEDDDDVKEAWDAEEDEEKKDKSGSDSGKTDDVMRAVQRKKKKPLAERIAEKEAARAAAEAKEKEENKVLTKEEKQAEAERLKKIQEEADLKLAKEAFGVSTAGVDSMIPVTEKEFDKFREALKNKITSFSSSEHYGAFLDKLIQDLIVDCDVDDVKKISTSANSLYHEKQRQQKELEKKKKKKGKGVIKAERDTDFGDIAAAGRGDYDDYYDDDFI